MTNHTETTPILTQNLNRKRRDRQFLLPLFSLRLWQLIVVCLVALASAGVAAADRVVRQHGRVFSVETITVARGEPVIFLNDDTVPHNIMSTTAENGFDLGSQMPGSATPVSFDKAGTVAVICAIHPRMHMSVIVTP